jgi:ADP-L-glycero-D-manno-heptose 6-epimerase
MILITGAAGFIGSCLVSHLNQQGRHDLILVDKFDNPNKQKNLADKTYHVLVERDQLWHWLNQQPNVHIEFVFHLGARTDTAEKDVALFDALNLNYTKQLLTFCTESEIPIIYASSAATYGLGERGYDDHTLPRLLSPLNPYGHSKNDLDQWILSQSAQPPFWAGLKFFNVYGPNEYHKGRMASVIWHTFQQIQTTGAMKLFRSHHPDYKNGEQSRDFIYVKDLLSVMDFLHHHQPESGIYNLGTGTARSFMDLVKNTFLALGKEAAISFIDTPEDIRDTYQYYTQAEMNKLRQAGYFKPFYTLEKGIQDYVQNYLIPHKYL